MNQALGQSVRRVLVIDDNTAIHDDFRKTLSRQSYGADLDDDEALLFGTQPVESQYREFEIDTASQGHIGLAMVEAALGEGRPYQLAFVDMRMPPGWDGVETISRLWQADPAIQVVICTAYSDYSWNQIVQKLGVTDRLLILKKPFDDVEVCQLASAMTGKWLATQLAQVKMGDLEVLVEKRTAELRDMALRDMLTGMPNRHLFNDMLSRAIALHRRDPHRMFAVLFLDMDRFKIVNDSLGHLIGDKLLVAFAQRLGSVLRKEDVIASLTDCTAARVGGDEFVVLLDGLKHHYDAMYVAERLLGVMAEPYKVDNHTLKITISIGVTTSALPYMSPGEIIRDADTAMYRAKAAGKNCFAIFDSRMHEDALLRMAMENDLRMAIEHDQFRLVYQPIVHLDSGRVYGFEALIRWQHPTEGVVSPLDFIPLAEEIGIIVPIGAWVLREACLELARWRRLPGLDNLFVSVNLSRKQLHCPNLIETIRDVIQETELPPTALKLEVTESAIMEDMDLAVIILGQIRDLGIDLHIDDFGTGYSSLSCLRDFPVSGMKIDRSFDNNVVDNPNYTAIINAIVTLAHNLRLELIAEGVETLDQMSLLKSMGCDFAQGYFFQRPLSCDQAL
ncbi:MAG: EAL domain-containing protein, partial [Desulfobulbus sp.]|nr:EAL domain-containing protein [Desulfobulbus sp.]